jgi:hypothetical protein
MVWSWHIALGESAKLSLLKLPYMMDRSWADSGSLLLDIPCHKAAIRDWLNEKSERDAHALSGTECQNDDNSMPCRAGFSEQLQP